MGAGELVGESRLADAGLTDDGDHLALADASLSQNPAQMLDLGVAADEAREAPERGGLQARSRRPRARQLEDLERVREALHRNRTQRPHLDVTLGEPHGLARQPYGPGRRELLHPGGEMG